MGRTSAEGYDALLLSKMKALISQSISATADDLSTFSPLTLEAFIKELDVNHVLEQTLFEALAQSIDKRRLSRHPTIVPSREPDSDEEFVLATDRASMRTAALNNTVRNLRARQAINPDPAVGDALASVRRLGRQPSTAPRQPTVDRSSSGFHVASNTDSAQDIGDILNQTDAWPTLSPRRHRIPVTTAEHNDHSHLWNFAQTRRVRREADSDIRAAAELVDEQMREANRTDEDGWEIVPPRRTLRRSNSIRRSGFRDLPQERDRSSSNPARHALDRRSAAPGPEQNEPEFTITDFPTSPRFSPASPRWTATSPGFAPASPRPASPRSPSFTPASPRPAASVNLPASPSFEPASPRFRPTSPSFAPASPSFAPNSPPFAPVSPRFLPTSPPFAAVSPYVAPAVPTSPRYTAPLTWDPNFNPAAHGARDPEAEDDFADFAWNRRARLRERVEASGEEMLGYNSSTLHLAEAVQGEGQAVLMSLSEGLEEMEEERRRRTPASSSFAPSRGPVE